MFHRTSEAVLVSFAGHIPRRAGTAGAVVNLTKWDPALQKAKPQAKNIFLKRKRSQPPSCSTPNQGVKRRIDANELSGSVESGESQANFRREKYQERPLPATNVQHHCNNNGFTDQSGMPFMKEEVIDEFHVPERKNLEQCKPDDGSMPALDGVQPVETALFYDDFLNVASESVMSESTSDNIGNRNYVDMDTGVNTCSSGVDSASERLTTVNLLASSNEILHGSVPQLNSASRSTEVEATGTPKTPDAKKCNSDRKTCPICLKTITAKNYARHRRIHPSVLNDSFIAGNGSLWTSTIDTLALEQFQ